MNAKDHLIYIQDILESIEKIEQYIENVDKVEFEDDEEKQDAVLRRIEVIGEAATKIPRTLQDNYPEIPWKAIIGTRNIIIHDYSSIDIDVIWDIVSVDLPKAKILFEEMI